MNDKEAKEDMITTMMSDLIGIADDPSTAYSLADHLIRKGWRKADG